jgi:hypothetical protein
LLLSLFGIEFVTVGLCCFKAPVLFETYVLHTLEVITVVIGKGNIEMLIMFVVQSTPQGHVNNQHKLNIQFSSNTIA